MKRFSAKFGTDVIYMLQSTHFPEGHKVFGVYQFVRHLAHVKEYLEKEGISVMHTLDGATKDRQAASRKISRKQEEIKVFLISIKARGVGLKTWTKGWICLFTGSVWEPLQSKAARIDRARRIGQQNKVIIYKFHQQVQLKRKLWLCKVENLPLAGELINAEESFMKSPGT